MKSPTILRKEDPFQFWERNYKIFPHLATLVYKFLAIPPTSADSERLFSSAGNFMTPKRISINCDKLNMLVFLRSNQFVNF